MRPLGLPVGDGGHATPAGKISCEVSEMDWKEIFTGDFLVNTISVVVGLVVYDKFVKKYIK